MLRLSTIWICRKDAERKAHIVIKLKFKTQAYQTSAVESVVDCFSGQVNTAGLAYRIDQASIVTLPASKTPIFSWTIYSRPGPSTSSMPTADSDLDEPQKMDGQKTLLENLAQ